MANNNTPKVFVPGTYINEKKFDNGGSILKVSVLVDKVVEFLQANKKDNGYINLVIQSRREPDERSTHTVTLDTWVPSNQASNQASKKPATEAPKQAVKSIPTKAKSKPVAAAPDDDDAF